MRGTTCGQDPGIGLLPFPVTWACNKEIIHSADGFRTACFFERHMPPPCDGFLLPRRDPGPSVQERGRTPNPMEGSGPPIPMVWFGSRSDCENTERLGSGTSPPSSASVTTGPRSGAVAGSPADADLGRDPPGLFERPHEASGLTGWAVRPPPGGLLYAPGIP